MDLSKYSDEELNAMLGEQEQSSPDLSAYSDDELQSMLPPEPQAMPSAAKTALDQALQGATFGFSDELTSALAAAPVSIVTGMSVPEAYRAGQELSKQQLTQQQEQRPILSGAANIAGGIGTGAAGMATKGGAAIASGLSRGLIPQARGLAGRAANLFSKATIGGITGAASGALYGAGTGEGNRMESARQGAIFGAGVGAALPVASAGLGAAAAPVKQAFKGFRSRDVNALEEAAGKIKSRSTKAYSKMKEIGAEFKPETSQNIISSISESLKNDGPLNAGLHGKTISVVSDLEDAALSGNFDIEKLDQWRQLLGQIAGNKTPDNLQDARKASIVMDAIDNVVNNLKSKDLSSGSEEAIKALNAARSEYSRQAKFNTVADIVKKADGDANYMKREFKKLLDNPKKRRGFTKDELDLLKKASSLSTAEAIGKTIGRFGFDVGNSRIGTGVGGAVGSAVGYAIGGGGTAAAVPIIGTAGRMMQKGIARAKAEDLLNLIENGVHISNEEILKLPPKEGMKVLNYLKNKPQTKLRITPKMTETP